MSLDISNIVASRICHDIISPIGAIHNGLELISMTASLDVKSPEMALIHDSCQDARACIEFFRVAFGTYQTGQLMDAPKVQGIANAIYTTPRFDLRWHLESAIDRTWAQVIYMGLMCVERQLTLGGTTTVAADADHIRIRITATSERLSVAHPGWERLSSDLKELPAPADVQFHLLTNIAGAYVFAVEFNHRETITTLTFRRG